MKNTLVVSSISELIGFVENKATKLLSNYINQSFITKEKKLFDRDKYQGYKILFSKKLDWAPIISNSFESSGILTYFEDFDYLDFNQYDLVIPLNIKDLLICNERRAQLHNQIIPIPTENSINICNNKAILIELLSQNGFQNLLPDSNYQNAYPYILKNSVGEYGNATFIIESKQNEKKFEKELSNPEYIKQQLIPGKHEFATHLLFKNNQIISQVTIKYTHPKSVYVQGSSLYVAKTLYNPDPKHLMEFKNILSLVGYEGLCCLDYKLLNGSVKLFEINPRFGGSLTDYFFSMLRHL